MSKRTHQNNRSRRERRLSIRSERLAEPDVAKLAGAVIALAMAQAEKEAAEIHAKQKAEPDA